MAEICEPSWALVLVFKVLVLLNWLVLLLLAPATIDERSTGDCGS